VLLNNANTLDKKQAFALSESLNEIITHVAANNLSINAEMLAFLKDSLISEDTTDSQKNVQ